MVRASGSLGLSGAEALRIPVTIVGEVEKVEGVQTGFPIAQNTVPVKDGLTGTRLVDGVDLASYSPVVGLQIVKGRAFTEGSDEVICDAAWAHEKKLNLGDSMPLYDRNFTLVGIYEPSVGGRVKIPLSTMQTQLGSEGKASAILVKIKDGFQQDAVAQSIQDKFPQNQIILTRDIEELYMQGIPALNVFLNVVIGVAGIVSALIILLTMYTTVTERTRQIGVLKSLGMSNLSSAWTIVQEALLISLGGVLLGVATTFILKAILANWTTLTVHIEPQLVLSIIAIGVLSGVVGAVYPGLRAARLDAVEALSYE
jgi:putative ABC transport system permease protein